MMNRYVAPLSKATPITRCQKCLNLGHYSYECTTPAQQRPYTTRPSRTQQLLNPKLMPKLNSDVMEGFLRKREVAVEGLGKIAHEGARKRQRTGNSDSDMMKRSRSISISSSASVATISTNRSLSPLPESNAALLERTNRTSHQDKSITLQKNRRSSGRRSSSVSRTSHLFDGSAARHHGTEEAQRSKRRRRNHHSPEPRGRSRTRSWSRSIHRADRSRSRNSSLDSRRRARNAGRSTRTNRGIGSDAHAQVEIKDVTFGPGSREQDVHEQELDRRRRDPESRFRVDNSRLRPSLRSLSPFSRRLALTQAMNANG